MICIVINIYICIRFYIFYEILFGELLIIIFNDDYGISIDYIWIAMDRYIIDSKNEFLY